MLAGLLFLMFLSTGLEMLGLGMFLPLLTSIVNPDSRLLGQILGYFHMEASGVNQPKLVMLLGAAVILVFLIKNVFSLSVIYVQNHIIQNRSAKMASDLLHGYLSLPYIFYLSRNPAEIMRNLTTSVGAVFGTALGSALGIIKESLIGIGVIAVLIMGAPPEALFVAALLAVGMALLSMMLKARITRWGEIDHALNAEALKCINQSIGSIKETKVNGCEDFFSRRFSRVILKQTHYAVLANTVNQTPQYFSEILVVTGLLLVMGAVFVHEGSFSNAVPVLGLVSVAALRLRGTFSSITLFGNLLMNNLARVNTIYDDAREILRHQLRDSEPAEKGEDALGPFRDRISIQNLGFTYPKVAHPALCDITMEICHGESVGIVGSTGAGKTTLVDVLLGLLTPGTGKILIDGRDMHKHLRAWQKLVGYVPQEIYITDDTLRRNIAFGIPDEDIDEEKLSKALSLSQLESVVEKLPDGLDTIFGDRGVRLSGGQRQRIGIARALYRDPQIVVMDEATSALDNETEHMLAQAIQSLSGNKTLIIIAHRLSTVRHCDVLVLLKKGRVQDTGKFDDLILRNKEFERQARLGNMLGVLDNQESVKAINSGE